MIEFTAQCIACYLVISLIIWSVGWLFTFLFIVEMYQEIQEGSVTEFDLEFFPINFFRINKLGEIKLSILYSFTKSFSWVIYPYKFLVLLSKQVEL